jgi:hypothetical protein
MNQQYQRNSFILDEWNLAAIDAYFTATNSSENFVNGERMAILNEEISDVQIVDGQLYNIVNKKIYKRSINGLSLNTQKEIVSEINSDKFTFLLFKHVRIDLTKNKLNWTFPNIVLLIIVLLQTYAIIYVYYKMLSLSLLIK